MDCETLAVCLVPRGISWEAKAILLGAVFHIDYTNYSGAKSFAWGGNCKIWY
jgi:hypothetical protein